MCLGMGVGGFVSRSPSLHLGIQKDGSFMVSTAQRVESAAISFHGRPSDLAVQPNGSLVAVMKKDSVFLIEGSKVLTGTEVPLGAEPGFHGLIWTPDGKRLIASTASGYLAVFELAGKKLKPESKIVLAAKNAVPGGMTVTKDGKSLFVAAANLNAILEIDLSTNQIVKSFEVGILPFTVELSEDEKSLIASNWGGRKAEPGELTAKSEDEQIVVDEKGVPTTGSVSLVDLASGERKDIEVGIHPTEIAISGQTAYVANAMSDSISEIDLTEKRLNATIPINFGKLKVLGAMPNALAVVKNTLLVADGGDNAIAEIDLKTRTVNGFRPAGFFPISIVLDGERVLVLNSKGNGSVTRTRHGKPGNAHDFEGSITILDRKIGLAHATRIVARDNGWTNAIFRPKLKVYEGAIKHVLYIIKENRTYDEFYGDLPQGNGDAALCDLGKYVPNQRALAQQFTLFDNAYVSGTNSADGHAWSTQALANDYLEHFYVGYARTYPFDGDCAMSISTGGFLWDQAIKKGLTFRDYGEFCDDELAKFSPEKPADWFQAWEDRKSGAEHFQFEAHTHVNGLKPYVHPTVLCWPLLQSDQSRADEFIKDYQARAANDSVPNLMMMSLPSDHSEGANPDYPTPRAMIADNDLALGRIVEAVSTSPQWKETCIFVIEDDAQSGPDHVDGHRTSFQVISPYNNRHSVDSHLYTTTSMVRSIEMMLGLNPMNRFDFLARPIDSCFNNNLDLSPFKALPNTVPLGEPNPGRRMTKMSLRDRYWMKKSESLDWEHLDHADPFWLNRIIWASVHPDGKPYPSRANEMPGRDEN